MDNKTFANQILRGLDTVFGIKAELGTNNICTITHKTTLQQYTIELPHEEKYMYLYTALEPIPFNNREQVYAFLLELNLHGLETRHASIAIDPKTKYIILSRVMDIEHINDSVFPGIFQEFIDTAAHVSDKLHQFLQSNEASAIVTDAYNNINPQQHIII